MAHQREVTTQPCLMCGESSVVTVDAEAFNRWRAGELVQNAFPEMSTNERELLLTGTHQACWDKMFAEDEK